MPPSRGGVVAIGMRAIARALAASIELRVEGLGHVPEAGPALLVCRHHHHFYDGVALIAAIGRPVRILVGLDWAKDRRQRAYMEMLCTAAGWPVVLRDPVAGHRWGAGYGLPERRRYARTALLRSVELLRRGDVLAMFPEGSPLIDPAAYGARSAWPPFAGGYLSIAWRASRHGIDVPLVPTGLHYAGPPARPDSITLRFGAPESVATARSRGAIARSLEARVRALST